MEWKYTDPRLDINKRANIIICRPDPVGRGWLIAGTGYVDTKEDWNIFTDFDDHKLINADDEWNEDWCWIRAPEKKL